MKLFDIFKKKQTANNQIADTKPIDNNVLLIETLKQRLSNAGYKVDKHPQYLALIVNSEIEIATNIIEKPDYHPGIIHLLVFTIHPIYFPKGIVENIVGIGNTTEEKIESVLDNYVNSTFSPIIDSFSDSHQAHLDLTVIKDGKEVLWHPKLGNLICQGQWDIFPDDDVFFNLVKENIKRLLASNKLNWLKLYISKRSDGTIIGECLFNNEPWDEGLEIISKYAELWTIDSDFRGLKQFMMFRRCDAYD